MLANLRAKQLIDRVVVVIGESSWLLLCFTVVTLFLTAGVGAMSGGVHAFMQTSLGQLVAGLLVYSFACALVVLPLWFINGRRDVVKTLGVDKIPRVKDMLVALPAWVLYMLATTTVGFVVLVLMPWIDGDQAQQIGFSDINTPLEYVIAFFALVILPPVAEEFMFRGYLYGRLRTRLRFVPSTLVVSLLFGFVHQQWNVAIDTFVLSLFLCYLRETTGSIWPSVLLHALKNMVAYTLLFIAPLMGWNLLQ